MAYFTTTVDCEILGSRQHVAAFSVHDNLFTWQEFEIPKGGAKLVGVTALIRGKGDATSTNNVFPFSLVFGRKAASDATNEPTTNSIAFLTAAITKDIYGSIEIEATDFVGAAKDNNCLAIATTGGNKASSIVLTQDSETPTGNPGYDKFYVAGIAQGAFDFITLNRINDANIATVSPGTTLVSDGSGMDIREQIMVGDVLVAHDDAVIGTVATLTNGTTTELTEDIATGVLVHQDFIYVKHPITLQLHFEN